MLELEYLTDGGGQLKAVVVPVGIWDKLFVKKDSSIEELSESMENYSMNRAMDEAKATPLLSREEALAYLEA